MARTFDAERDEKNLNPTGKKTKTPLLDYFGRDLTKLASESELDPVYGRDKEIEEIIQVLNKRKKNNPLLVGEPGVGKTAVVEGLAIKIHKKEAEVWLLNKRIVEINITSMVSGTKYRGEFEQRMEELIKEIENNPDIIIFIDEIHNVVGAGGTSGSMDAANIIKPALSKGTMKCIGATTFEEYKKHIENEGAFERRFQKIYVNEPTKEETEILLNSIKGKYEEYHCVEYSEEVIKTCIDYADKYITYRKFPDKAIDLLDEVGSRVKLKNVPVPGNFKELEAELEKTVLRKKEASKNQNFEEAARHRDDERRILEELDNERKVWERETKKNKIKVKSEDVACIIASHTGIPVVKLTDSENKKFLSISDYLKEKIIGQDEAVQKVEEAMQRSRLGIQDPFRPLASFLFLGPTGVGKTLMAKLIASHLFHTNDSFIRIDMSEYEEKHSVSKLIGSPPGYIGHEDKGQLTEKVKNRPYSLILFDEIEKAHPDVFNVFLQVLDEGKLTDSTGAEINFKNTIIIMTSNIGTRSLLEGNSLGFGVKLDTLKNDKSLVFKELEKSFKPEFLNRIDEKVVFNPLGKEQIEIIAKIEMDMMLFRLKEKGYNITVSKEVVLSIATVGYDKKYGARPIKRAISERVGNLISKAVLKKEVVVNKKYSLILENDEIVIHDETPIEQFANDSANIEKPKKIRKNARDKSE
jgi:ATP-dependent Clp protease ATP-binding subunit ClpC